MRWGRRRRWRSLWAICLLQLAGCGLIVWVGSRFGSDAKDEQDMLVSALAASTPCPIQAHTRQGFFVPHGLSRSQCEVEIMLQVVAGSDTTANVIRATMLLLATHPVAYARLQREINEATSTGLLSRPAASAEARTHLPFLQAVLYEATRVHPPALTLLPKVVPEGGDTLPGGV